MYDSDIEIRPKHGWANIQLGNSLAEVRAALATNGHPYDLSSDEFTLDIHSPETTFYFNDSTPKQLVQIVFYDQGHRVDGAPVIGLPLDEAMLPFNVKGLKTPYGQRSVLKKSIKRADHYTTQNETAKPPRNRN